MDSKADAFEEPRMQIGVLAILQARMSSSRLPGKVLKSILGRPMLELQIERILRCKRVDRLVVATSSRPDDREIVFLCERLGVDSFAGHLENVLDRFYKAALRYRPEHIVRLTGDCPLIDSALIDDLISFYMRRKCDYASNCFPPTLPDGLDAEIFTFGVLEQAWKEAVDPLEIEHVTPFVRRHPERFAITSWKYRRDLSNLRWTVDEAEDFELVREIYSELYPKKPNFSTEDILELLREKPHLADINTRHKRNIKTDARKNLRQL